VASDTAWRFGRAGLLLRLEIRLNNMSGAVTRYGLLVAAAMLVACHSSDKEPQAAPRVPSSSSPTPDSIAITPKAVLPREGPRIIIDSGLTEAKFEHTAREFILRLPTDMAQALYDSLPEFVPYQVSAWSPEAVHYTDWRSNGGAIPSLVVGDFNGDSKQDVAMQGSAKNASGFFILLAKSDSVRQSALLFAIRLDPQDVDPDIYMGLIRPQEFQGDSEREPFELRTDAVMHGYSDKAASIYFVRGGAIASYNVSD
jgi:hypothetical protein